MCAAPASASIEKRTARKRLANALGTTVGEAVAIATRRLSQEQIGKELNAPVSRHEVDWLDAELG